MIDILVIPISNPILVGVYKNNKLIQSIKKDGKTSDILPIIIEDILNKYNLSSIYYVNGPGSYMAIKIAYIFLKSIAITKDIDFFATNGFHFNNNTPIKALGKKYFFNSKDDKITIELLKDLNIIKDFELPVDLDATIFTKDCLPQYNLPAVY